MAAEDQAQPTIEVTISTGVFDTENSQKFALQAGGSLRIGRDATNHVALDLNGVSAIHAELLFQRLDDSKASPLDLCICDHSRNGTAVRPGPHVLGSSWASKIAPPWERLVPGVPRALTHGWQVLAPAKSRKGERQEPFHKRMLTVYTNTRKAPEVAHVAAALQEAAMVAPTAATMDGMKPLREKKRKRKDDPARDRKRTRVPEVATGSAPAVAVAPVATEHDRRVAQCGAVEEALARRSHAEQEVARTARPKRKGQPAQAATGGTINEDDSDHTILPDELSDGDGHPSPAQKMAADEAEAATRAVAAAAALRAIKKKTAIGIADLAKQARKSAATQRPIDTIDSDDGEAEEPKKTSTLNTANLATLGGTPTGIIEMDMGSVSDISTAGVKPKTKKIRRDKAGKLGASPSVDRRGKNKPRLVGRQGADSPARWNPSMTPARKKKKKQSARSDDGRPARMSSRERRKGRR